MTPADRSTSSRRSPIASPIRAWRHPAARTVLRGSRPAAAAVAPGPPRAAGRRHLATTGKGWGGAGGRGTHRAAAPRPPGRSSGGSARTRARRRAAAPSGWAGQQLRTAQGCPICAARSDPEWVLAETRLCLISAPRDAALPGYACVLYKRHVVEPFELSESEQAEFFADSMAAARGLAELFTPVKMNYEIHGNTVPHLHMHLFPRMAADVYVGYPNHCRARFTRTSAELDSMGQAVRNALGLRLLHQQPPQQ